MKIIANYLNYLNMKIKTTTFLVPINKRIFDRNKYTNIPIEKTRVIDSKIKSMNMNEKRKALLVIDACLLACSRIATNCINRIKLDSLRGLVQGYILKELKRCKKKHQNCVDNKDTLHEIVM